MPIKLEDLTPEDRERYIRIRLQADTARCSVLSPEETYNALSAELKFMHSLPERYALPEDTDWELDPIMGAIYERSD